MRHDGKAGKGPATTEAGVLASLGFGPDSVLMNDPKLFADGRFLASLLAELDNELGPNGAREALFQIGACHGQRDAMRVLSGRWAAESGPARPPVCGSTALVMTLSSPHFGTDRFEVHGEWPERHEAESRLTRLGRAEHPSCRLSAGYTSGWLTTTHELDVVVVETECAAAGAASCRFRALDATSFATEFGAAALPPMPRLQDLGKEALQAARPDTAPSGQAQVPEFDPDEEAVHVWGPVMVLPVCAVDECLRTVEMLGRDPNVAGVRVVVLDLRGRVLDDDLGAAGLEHILSIIESWGAESILASVSPLSEHVVAELESARLVTRKELPDAIAAAFQIAEAQRHVL